MTPYGLPTRANPHRGLYSTIDLAFACGRMATKTAVTSEINSDLISDHFPVIVDIEGRIENPNIDNQPRFIFKKANWKEYRTSLGSIELEKELNSFENIEDKICKFQQLLLETAEKIIPQSKKGKTRHKEPIWWNTECENTKKAMNRAANNYGKILSTENYIKLKQAKAKFVRATSDARIDSWTKFVESLNFRDSYGKVYKFIKRMASRNNPPNPNTPVQFNGELIFDDKKKAEAGVRHLSQTIGKEDPFIKTVLHSKVFSKARKLAEEKSNEPYNLPFTDVELEVVLNKLPETAPGPDRIHPALLKNLPTKWRQELLKIINILWKEGRFPDCWKKGIALMIPKPGNLVENHRFITLLPVVGKIYERLVKKRLVYTVEKTQILQDIQNGFRQGRSTTDSLLSILRDSLYALNNRKVMILIFLDVKGAFDNIVHRQILNGLVKANIQGTLMNFSIEYMSGREVAVLVGESKSENKVQIKRGVPQGSVLGPDYYNISEHDIPIKDDACNGCIFADDNKTWTVQDTVEEAEKEAQQILLQIETWASTLDIVFEPSKAKAMVITQRRNIRQPVLKFYGENIEIVKEYKALGIILDCKMRFTKHIENLKISCLKKINLMKMMAGGRYGANPAVMREFYIKYIRPKIEYGATIYGSANEGLLNKLEVIQNTAIRIAFGAKHTTPIPFLLIESGIEKLSTRRDVLLLKYIQKLWTSDKNHPIKKHIVKRGLFHTMNPNKLRKHLNPFEKAEALMTVEGLNFSITRMLQYKKPIETPPWLWMQIPCTIEKIQKNERNPLYTKMEFNKLITEKFQNFCLIYTDGSKIEGKGVGAAAFVPQKNLVASRSLGQYSTVFEAEIEAIEIALDLIQKATIKDKEERKFAICSDSKAAILSLQNFTSNQNQEVSFCYNTLLQLLQNGYEIQLVWTPAHVGIQGNEMADKHAKIAAAQPLDCLEGNEYKELRAIRGGLRKRRFGLLKDLIHGQLVAQKKHNHFDSKIYSKLKKRNCNLLFRFRSGHVSTNARLFRIGKIDSPVCKACNLKNETVHHYLIECPFYERLRKDMRIICQKEKLGSLNVSLMLGIGINDDVIRLEMIMMFLKFVKFSGRMDDFS